jgi:hypothetical protein
MKSIASSAASSKKTTAGARKCHGATKTGTAGSLAHLGRSRPAAGLAAYPTDDGGLPRDRGS